MAAVHAQAFDAPWTEADFDSLMRAPGVHALAESRDDQVCGVILLRIAADEVEVLTLAVLPHYRRRGVARTLISFLDVLAAAKGVTRAFLEVAHDNAAAVALYTAAGFAQVGRRPGYYARKDGPAADALILSQDLTFLSP